MIGPLNLPGMPGQVFIRQVENSSPWGSSHVVIRMMTRDPVTGHTVPIDTSGVAHNRPAKPYNYQPVKHSPARPNNVIQQGFVPSSVTPAYPSWSGQNRQRPQQYSSTYPQRPSTPNDFRFDSYGKQADQSFSKGHSDNYAHQRPFHDNYQHFQPNPGPSGPATSIASPSLYQPIARQVPRDHEYNAHRFKGTGRDANGNGANLYNDQNDSSGSAESSYPEYPPLQDDEVRSSVSQKYSNESQDVDDGSASNFRGSAQFRPVIRADRMVPVVGNHRNNVPASRTRMAMSQDSRGSKDNRGFRSAAKFDSEDVGGIEVITAPNLKIGWDNDVRKGKARGRSSGENLNDSDSGLNQGEDSMSMGNGRNLARGESAEHSNEQPEVIIEKPKISRRAHSRMSMYKTINRTPRRQGSRNSFSTTDRSNDESSEAVDQFNNAHSKSLDRSDEDSSDAQDRFNSESSEPLDRSYEESPETRDQFNREHSKSLDSSHEESYEALDRFNRKPSKSLGRSNEESFESLDRFHKGRPKSLSRSNEEPPDYLDRFNKKPPRSLDRSNEESSEYLDRLNQKPYKSLDRSNEDSSESLGRFNRKPSKSLDHANVESSESVDRSNREHSKSSDRSNKESSEFLDRLNKKPSKSLHRSTEESSESLDHSNEESSESLDRSNEESFKPQDRSKKEPSKSLDDSNEESLESLGQFSKESPKSLDRSIEESSESVDRSEKKSSGSLDRFNKESSKPPRRFNKASSEPPRRSKAALFKSVDHSKEDSSESSDRFNDQSSEIDRVEDKKIGSTKKTEKPDDASGGTGKAERTTRKTMSRVTSEVVQKVMKHSVSTKRRLPERRRARLVKAIYRRKPRTGIIKSSRESSGSKDSSETKRSSESSSNN